MGKRESAAKIAGIADKSEAELGKILFDSAGLTPSKGLEGIKLLEKVADPVGNSVEDAKIDEQALRDADEATLRKMEVEYNKAVRAQAEALSAEELERKEKLQKRREE